MRRLVPFVLFISVWAAAGPGSGGTSSGTSTTEVTGTITCNQGTVGAAGWKVDGSAVTQPVSGTLTCNAGTGTLNVDIQDSSVPVTGTFWQATQPVSGTFWQTTQPVSGTLTCDVGAGTQPVSGTVTANAGSGTFSVGDGAGPLTVDGTLTCNAGSGTLNVDIQDTSLPVTQSGTWSDRITDGTDTAQVTTTSGGALQVECVGGCGSASVGQTYFASALGVTSGASKDYINLSNASGSGKILKILRISASVDSAAAVTGLQPGFTVSRFTTVGATCTAITIQLVDTTNSAVPAQVTANTNCTTDPTGLTNLFRASFYSDETQQGVRDLYFFRNTGGQPITLREGQGITLISGATAPVGVDSLVIEFTM